MVKKIGWASIALLLGCAHSTSPPKGPPDHPVAFVTPLLPAMQPHMNAPAKRLHRASYKICVNQGGRVERVEVLEGASAEDEQIVKHVKQNWLFWPNPKTPCFTLHLHFEHGEVENIDNEQPLRISPETFEAQRVSWREPHLSPAFRDAHARQQILGVYDICIDRAGRIRTVLPIAGIFGQDALLGRQLKQTWIFRPQNRAVCGVRAFRFIIN